MKRHFASSNRDNGQPPGSIHDADAPILSQAAGGYSERAPRASLRSHFVCAWRHEIAAGRDRTLSVPPDGCIDLQWVNGALRIAGPDREPNIEHLPAGSTVFGMRFQAGSAARWLRIPASDIVDQRLPLEAFWGTEARYIGDWIGGARTTEDIANRFELAMARKTAALDEDPDAAARLIFRLVEEADRRPGTEIIDLLRDRLGMSERTLRRKCHAAFGYGPKMLDRILRFQRFLKISRSDDGAPLAGLAGEIGYADQAHLSRETRRLAGLTPGAVLTQVAG